MRIILEQEPLTDFGLNLISVYLFNTVNSTHAKRYQLLCNLLIEARKNKGLSQASLAEKLGVLQTFVSKYERGERRLDVIEFLKIAGELSLDTIEVLERLQNSDG